MKIISGNSNKILATAVSERLAIPLTNVNIRRFKDKEVFVEILENVRGEDVFVLQSTSNPANDNLMELLIIIDTLKRGSAKRITAVIPYMGYARQDRKTGPRTPISAKLVANIITAAGADRVLTFDFHAGQIQGFFDIPVDNLYAAPIFTREIHDLYDLDQVLMVSPDVGGVARTRVVAKRLDVGLAIVDKRRESPGVSHVMNVIGEVKNKICILVDDIIDSGGTLCNAAQALLESGAKQVSAYVSHAVFAGEESVANVNTSPLTEVVVTDTIKPTPVVESSTKVRILSVAPLLAEAMRRISNEESVSTLFD